MNTSRHALRPSTAQSIRYRLGDDSAEEGLSPAFARSVLWFPLAGAVVMAGIFVASRPAFYRATAEDRPLEWIQFALCLITALVAVAAAVRFARLGAIPATLLMLVLGLGMIGLAGEEISWGQRVLGIATPENIAAANKQSETNIHNLEVGVSIGDIFKVLEFVICVGGTLLALAVRAARVPAPPSLRLLAPPLVTIPCLLMMAGYQAAQFLVVPDSWAAVARLQELAELGLYVGLATLALVAFTGARRHPYAALSPRVTSPLTPADVRIPLIITGGVAVLTVVFSILSFFSGIDPGNI